MNVDDAWDAIIAWCDAQAPEAMDAFGPPAPDEALEPLDAEIGVLPAAVRRSWSRVGFTEVPGPLPFRILPPHESFEVWTRLRRAAREVLVLPDAADVDPGVRAAWVHPGWLPLTDDGGGNHVCVDLDPAPGGAVGQVIVVLADHPRRSVLAPSWTDFLEGLVDALEGGRLVATEDRGRFFGVLRKADLVGPLAGLKVRGEDPVGRLARRLR